MILSVDNPNKFLPKNALKAAFKSKEDFSDIIDERITQRKSQMKFSISKFLHVLYDNEELNLTEIRKKTGLHHNSIDRVKKLVEHKKLVFMKQYNDNENNAKFYSLNKNRAVVYLNHLFNYRKNILESKKQFKFIESVSSLLKKAPDNFMRSYIFFDNETKKKWKIPDKKSLAVEIKPVNGSEYKFLTEIRRRMNTLKENDPRNNYYSIRELLLLADKIHQNNSKDFPSFLRPLGIIKKILQSYLNRFYCENCIESLPAISKCIRCNNPNCRITNCENCRKLFDKNKMDKIRLIPITELFSSIEYQDLEVCSRCGETQQLSFLKPKVKGETQRGPGTIDSNKRSYSEIKNRKKKTRKRLS